MTRDVVEFRIREGWAEATLKQASDLPPEDRTEPVFLGILKAVEEWTSSLELLWGRYRKRLHRSGISPDEASSIARSLDQAVENALRVLHVISPLSKQELLRDEEEIVFRLEGLRAQARPLLKIASRPLPPFDPSRVQKGSEEVQRGEGIDAEEFLTQLKQVAAS